MRYIVYGAGGVGCAIGAPLHLRGHEVVLVARGAQLEALREPGLTLKTPRGIDRVRIPTAGHPREIEFRDGDVVVLAMKTQDTSGALADLREAGGEELPLVCAQNGVENERIAARSGADVYAMVVWLPATFLEPGVVLNHGHPTPGILDLGRYPSGVDGCAERIAADLRDAGFGCEPQHAIMRWKYEKLLTNLRTSIAAICGLGAQAGDLAGHLRREALACYEAAGIDHATAEEAAQRRGDARFGQAEIAGETRGGGSAWQSTVRGVGSIETDYINGEIVLLGQLHGVATPYNRALQRVANRVARERLQPGAYSVEDIEREARALAD